MANISISQLQTAATPSIDDLVEVAVPDRNSASGYASKKESVAQVADLMARTVQYQGLDTEAKTLVGAINEAAENGGTEVEANPTGEPTDTLETIGIDGTVYEVGGSSEPVSKTATGNPIHIEDAADAPIVNGEVTFEPQQDLHGYDKPWVGGAGKNKLEVTATNQTVNGVTFTVNDDGSITVNGTATNSVVWPFGNVSSLTDGAQYILSGVSGGASTTYRIDIRTSGEGVAEYLADGETTFTKDSSMIAAAIRIEGGYTLNNMIFYPMIRLATETDPTFEPYSNICPITGYDDCEVEVTGKNLFDNSLFNTDVGTTITYNHFAVPNGNYVMSTPNFPIIDERVNVFFMTGRVTSGASSDSNGVYKNKPIPITVLDGYYTVAYRSNNLDNYNNPKDFNWQIELGTEPTPYEPYQSKTYTIDLDGTRYGGTVDLVSGVMTVDRAIVDLGTLEWVFNQTQVPYFSAIISEEGVFPNCICSIYPASDKNSISLQPDKTIRVTNHLYIKDSSYSDATVFKNAMTGQQVVYELATPFTVQLTPEQIRTLEGTNNISTNMTEMSLEYITQDYQPLVDLAEDDSDSALHDYSSEEQVVGTWIDGKPVYERVYTGTISTSGIHPLVNGLSFIDNIIKMDFLVKARNNTLTPVYYASGSDMQRIWIEQGDEINVQIGSSYPQTPCNYIIILRYTKTTD